MSIRGKYCTRYCISFWEKNRLLKRLNFLRWRWASSPPQMKYIPSTRWTYLGLAASKHQVLWNKPVDLSAARQLLCKSFYLLTYCSLNFRFFDYDFPVELKPLSIFVEAEATLPTSPLVKWQCWHSWTAPESNLVTTQILRFTQVPGPGPMSMNGFLAIFFTNLGQ